MTTTYTFNDFMQAIDAEISMSLGCSTADLTDYPYHEDWETCAEDLAFIAPEDEERQSQVFNNHVSYTVQDLKAETYSDAHPYTQGVDY